MGSILIRPCIVKVSAIEASGPAARPYPGAANTGQHVIYRIVADAAMPYHRASKIVSSGHSRQGDMMADETILDGKTVAAAAEAAGTGADPDRLQRRGGFDVPAEGGRRDAGAGKRAGGDLDRAGAAAGGTGPGTATRQADRREPAGGRNDRDGQPEIPRQPRRPVLPLQVDPVRAPRADRRPVRHAGDPDGAQRRRPGRLSAGHPGGPQVRRAGADGGGGADQGGDPGAVEAATGCRRRTSRPRPAWPAGSPTASR